MLGNRSWRFVVRLAVCVLVLAVMAPTAFAFDLSGTSVAKAGGNGRGHAKGGAPRFSDVPTGDWAYGDIAFMAAKGLMNGYGGGRFGPKNHVTRLELVILATRLFGHEDDALDQAPEDVNDALCDSFTDVRGVPSWVGARESLAFALGEDYLWPLMMDNSASFRPNAPAKRIEVIVVLLEGAGFGEEAEALAGAPIAFADASAIPLWAWGYVALGVELGLVRGSGGVLQPNKPVIRAEMAALLHRLDEIIETGADEGIVRGEVVSISVPEDETQPTNITVATATGDETYPLVSGVVVMSGGKQAALDDVEPGLDVTLYLNQDGYVLLIDIAASAPGATVTGTILGTILDSEDELVSITLEVDDEVKAYAAAGSVAITMDGEDGTVEDLVNGITVVLTLDEDGKVLAIAIEAEEPDTTEVTGTILGTVLDSEDELVSITLEVDDEVKAYAAASSVAITMDGEDGTVEDLVNGITVALTLDEGGKVLAIAIEAEEPETTEVTGMILGTVLDSEDELVSITLWVDDEAEVYTPADSLTITKDGEDGTLEDLVQGAVAKLTLDEEGLVIAITIGTL